MFRRADAFNQDISAWDVSSVRTLDTMFLDATSFDQAIGSWDVSNVNDMGWMFFNASAFNQDLSGWCVTQIPVAPTSFSAGATSWLLPLPVWGTCP
jgi:surface protein